MHAARGWASQRRLGLAAAQAWACVLHEVLGVYCAQPFLYRMAVTLPYRWLITYLIVEAVIATPHSCALCTTTLMFWTEGTPKQSSTRVHDDDDAPAGQLGKAVMPTAFVCMPATASHTPCR